VALGPEGITQVVSSKTATSNITLLGFNSIDTRETKVGDTVVFRAGSITHNRELALRHGSYAKVVGFGRSAKSGTEQVSLKFKDGTVFPMATSNVVARTPAVDEAAPAAHSIVQQISRSCIESERPWMTLPKLQVVLGDLGMYDRLGQQAPVGSTALDDLPY
jgi:hypothetical protein